MKSFPDTLWDVFNFFLVGIHPSSIVDSFQKASKKAVSMLEEIAIPLDFQDRSCLLKSATTSLNSKAINSHIYTYTITHIFNCYVGFFIVFL